MTTLCYACNQEISFDEKHVSPTGKKIPLNAATKEPHDCPARRKEYPRSTQGQAMRQSYPTTASPTTDLPDDDEGYDDKYSSATALATSPKKTMEQMHDENIAAWNAQTDAIKQLSLDVGMLTAAITRYTSKREIQQAMDEANANRNREPNWEQ